MTLSEQKFGVWKKCGRNVYGVDVCPPDTVMVPTLFQVNDELAVRG